MTIMPDLLFIFFSTLSVHTLTTSESRTRIRTKKLFARESSRYGNGLEGGRSRRWEEGKKREKRSDAPVSILVIA